MITLAEIDDAKKLEQAIERGAVDSLVMHLTFEIWNERPDDLLVGARLSDGGKITVLDRMTGWGYGVRDIETGYRDKDNKFWLASGNFDIREFPGLTISEAIEKIKLYANTCLGA